MDFSVYKNGGFRASMWVVGSAVSRMEDFLFAANQKACWRAGDCQSTLRLDEHHRERQPRVLHLFFLRVI